MEEGFTVALTPIQLAAIISGGTLEGSASGWTRAWGGAKLIFGGLEALGAGALLLVPEPTMVTKIGGVALGAHGADTIQSGARQLWSGQDTRTLTSEGTAALAQVLGVDEATARQVGEGVDMAVPIALTLGLGAARLAAVRGGRIILAEHEAATLRGVGGHTIARHVAQTDAQLAARLATSSRLSAVSTFGSLAEAETAISAVMRAQRGGDNGVGADRRDRLAPGVRRRRAACRHRSGSPTRRDVASRRPNDPRRAQEGGVQRQALLHTHVFPRTMSESTAFPSLRNLMESYFNQDFDLYGDDDQAVIAQFRTDSSRGDVDATLVEIDRLLAMPATGLCQLFKSETGRFNVSIGETDADTRDWLLSAREILARPR